MEWTNPPHAENNSTQRHLTAQDMSDFMHASEDRIWNDMERYCMEIEVTFPTRAKITRYVLKLLRKSLFEVRRRESHFVHWEVKQRNPL